MTAAASEVLLNECREFMTYRMRTSMSRMMGNIETTLFELASLEHGGAQTSHYIDAVREFRMKKREIQVRFENRFMSLFDEGVRQIREGGRMNIFSPVHLDYARKVVDMNLDESRAIEHTMEKVRSECRTALSDLDRHVSALLDTQEFDHFDNPMQPKTVFNAFWESCCDIQAGADIRLILVQMFERHVASDLQHLYEDLNNMFISYESTGDKAGETMLVRNWVADKLQAKMQDQAVPDFVRDFLLRQWSLVLEKIYGKHGENSLAWNRAMQAVDDLMASVNTTVSKEVRRQQIWMLPGLIYRLKNGMKSVPVPLNQQADFLSRLKAYHISLAEVPAATS